MCFDPHTPLMSFPSASVLFPAVSPPTHGFHFRKCPYWVWVEWLCARACVRSLTRHEQLTSGCVSLRKCSPLSSLLPPVPQPGMAPHESLPLMRSCWWFQLVQVLGRQAQLLWVDECRCHVMSRRQHFIALFPIIRFFNLRLFSSMSSEP